MNENHANLLLHLLAISNLISQCIDCLQEGEDADHPKEAGIIPPSAPHDLRAEMPSGVLERPSLPTDSLATLRKVLAEKSLAGYAGEVRVLIKKHGANSLNSVDSSHYADMLREAAEIGGNNRD